MWDLALRIAIGFGGVLAFTAFKNRKPRTPPSEGVDEKTGRKWSLSGGSAEWGDVVAANWKTNLAVGLALLTFGVAGTIIRVFDDDTPSREDFIEAIASDSSNTYDRDEAECVVDLWEALGLEPGSASEDEAFDIATEGLTALDPAELAQYEDCLDDETRDRSNDTLAQLTDDQLRQLYAAALANDPDIERPVAECIASRLDEEGMLREVAESEGRFSAELDAVILDAATLCESATSG